MIQMKMVQRGNHHQLLCTIIKKLGMRICKLLINSVSDHSLVAGSPRIIAGSNVLHRLLVPRHPPCALINLTLGTTCNSADYRRCSRPLCSSQDTDGTMRRDLPSGRSHPQAVRVSALEKRLLPQDPTVCSESLSRQALVPQLPRREERTNRVALARKPNSQCSTRKHGRPGERSPPEDAGAP